MCICVYITKKIVCTYKRKIDMKRQKSDCKKE